MIAVVRDVQQQECLCDGVYKVEADKPPCIRPECVKGNPTARQHCQPHSDFGPHDAVGLGGNISVGKEIVEAPPQDSWECRRTRGVGNGVPQRGLSWNKIINLRVQTNNRLVSDVTDAMMLGRLHASRPGLPRVD